VGRVSEELARMPVQIGLPDEICVAKGQKGGIGDSSKMFVQGSVVIGGRVNRVALMLTPGLFPCHWPSW